MLIVAYLETSRIPTISLKKTRIKTEYMKPLAFCVALLATFLFTQTWLTFGVLIILYALSIPFSVYRFNKEKKAYEQENA